MEKWRNSFPRKEIGSSYPGGGEFVFLSLRNGIRYNGKTSCKLGEVNIKLREFLCKVGELNIDTSYRIFTDNVVITFLAPGFVCHARYCQGGQENPRDRGKLTAVEVNIRKNQEQPGTTFVRPLKSKFNS